MFHIVEPQWWINLLMSLNAWMMSSPTLIYWIPKLADLFVFVYPLFLVLLYFRRPISRLRGWSVETLKRWNEYYKISALFIAFSVLVTVVVNLLIQYVFDKVRPDVVLWLLDNKTESILHRFLPSSSFPSDHAAVSMSIAMATLLWGITKKDRRFVRISIPLFAFSLIMSFCRIMGGIHWPTDIIAGSIIWIVVPLILMAATNPYPKGTLPFVKGHQKWLERLFSRIGKKI
jgi:membrane-associated phospholipid phosphatase